MISFYVDHDARIPVPNEGMCDKVEEKGGLTPSCSNCAKYYDGRIDHDFSKNPCVYVAKDDKCYPKKYALDEGFDICDWTHWLTSNCALFPILYNFYFKQHAMQLYISYNFFVFVSG